MLTILRQPRYLGLFALMVLVATICCLAGTWQIFRFEQKHDANDHLRTDARDRIVAVQDAMGPAGSPTSNGQAQKFRIVTATGTYLPTGQTLLRGQTTNGSDIGYLVITPLRTDAGVLLVARGLVPQNNAANTTPTVPSAPSGPVTVTARLQPSATGKDRFGQLPGTQIETVNAASQSSRLKAPVWNAYAELLPGQAGSSGLTSVPAPDLSNPAGGAEEPQHLAYVVQWYLFGLLALAAPLVMARAELKREAAATPVEQPGTEAPTRRQRKASLDDRLAGRA